MKYKIYYKIGEYQDNIIIEGETIEEIKENVASELGKRGAIGLWSEKIN